MEPDWTKWHAIEEGYKDQIAKLRVELQEARGCVRMLLTCASPNAKDHPMMWDAWGDAAVWLGEDRNRHRIPHVDLQGNARACGRATKEPSA